MTMATAEANRNCLPYFLLQFFFLLFLAGDHNNVLQVVLVVLVVPLTVGLTVWAIYCYWVRYSGCRRRGGGVGGRGWRSVSNGTSGGDSAGGGRLPDPESTISEHSQLRPQTSQTTEVRPCSPAKLLQRIPQAKVVIQLDKIGLNSYNLIARLQKVSTGILWQTFWLGLDCLGPIPPPIH